jgi:2-C-methyl-D-erythritol 4-phosphate cytidylyltransferase / 2-C-methyl-D-erythritol 2,4-cyclodiphosphate synthase
MYVTAIIAAGGRGERLGGAVPKQLIQVGGRSLLERSVSIFQTHPAVDEIVVALPGDLVADPPPYLKVSAKPLRLVIGGERRQDSVVNAFNATNETSDIIVIHDAARPFASQDLVTRTIAAAVETGAAAAALAARDTVKRAGRSPVAGRSGGLTPELKLGPTSGSLGPASGSLTPELKLGPTSGSLGPTSGSNEYVVLETIPRETIYLAQTPQAFRRNVLRDAIAFAQTGVEVTDEATLAERAGHPVRVVPGEPTNIKITTTADLPVAEALAGGGSAALITRVGTGYDLHRLVEGRPLTLAGVTIPFEKGLAGHSDADVIAHAAIDAMLGAAGAGDIGGHFPDTDPQWKGASSIDLMRRASEILRNRGFAVVNLDLVVIAERPKLAGYLDAMRRNLASAAGVRAADVSIKGKTNEGVGELGRGEAIAVHAVALVKNL